ncbi:MAG: A/G-specific adenine glycosylase [Planctomycetes bacterium]|nr:A/G-specific adenine glycosylase [Planctomycetota bacterium]
MTEGPRGAPHGTPEGDLAVRLLAWFDAHRRDLPWRRNRDPWSIWVSEVMLQQTRVEAVRAAFERFIARFPTPAAFAAADDDEVLRAWRGLGYYRRARLLRDGARAVVAEHAGAVPPDPEQLGRLPGIGSYTRGAIASIAFDRREAAIDGNVERVAARHRGIAAEIKSAVGQRAVRAFVEATLPDARPGDFNQALMELGATVCTPTSPRCGDCPVGDDCVAHAAGRTAELPVRKPRRAPLEIGSRAVLVRRGGDVLGARVPAGEPNAGQVELPGAGVLVTVDASDLRGILRTRYGAAIEVGAELARIRHAITHHRITLTVHTARVDARGTLSWHPEGDETPWTTPARKAFAATGEQA